jgi:mRNA-degrading endonuclease YafQ of YafQ-DinJ toxin-antitoxin module
MAGNWQISSDNAPEKQGRETIAVPQIVAPNPTPATKTVANPKEAKPQPKVSMHRVENLLENRHEGLAQPSSKQRVAIRSSAAEYLTYAIASGAKAQSVDVLFEDENLWMTQKMMATLYDVDVRTINEHIANIFTDSELQPEATIRDFRIVQTEGIRPDLLLIYKKLNQDTLRLARIDTHSSLFG